MPICPPGDPNGKFQVEPCSVEADTPTPPKREVIADLPDGVVERDTTGQWYLNGNPIDPSISTFQDVISRALAQANAPAGSGGGPTLSPNTVAQINEDARQFDITRQDRAKEFNAAAEQQDTQFYQGLAQEKFEFDASQKSIADRFNAQTQLELEKIAVQEARADTNMRFAIKQEEAASARDNRNAQMQAARDVEAVTARIERTKTERTQIVNLTNQFNATQRANADTFNAQMEFQIDNENQRRREFGVQELRANARDIAEFSQNPQDVGKIAAFLRAGGGGALTEAAQAGEVGFTEESLAPLQGFLGAKSFLEQGPELATFDPIEAQQAATPEFGGQDTTIPTVGGLTGGDIGFDPSGIQQQGPGIDPTNLFVGPGEVSPAAAGLGPVTVDEPLPSVSPPLTPARRDNTFIAPPVEAEPGGPTTTGGTPIVPTAPGAAEPIVRDGEVRQVEPVVSPGVFTALKPSGQVDADLAEFDRRIAESGIDPEAAAGMREQLERQSQERGGVLGLAQGGTTDSNIFRVGEPVNGKPNEEIVQIDFARRVAEVTPLRDIPGAQTGGLFASPIDKSKAQINVEPQIVSRSASMVTDPFADLTSTDIFAARKAAGDTSQLVDLRVRDEPEFGVGLPPVETKPGFTPAPVSDLFGGVAQQPAAPTPIRQPLGLASAQEADIFQRGVSEEAFRRIGVSSAADATPIKVGAPGTSQFLRDAAFGAISTTGLFNEQTFFEELERVKAQGVRAGTSRRTA